MVVGWRMPSDHVPFPAKLPESEKITINLGVDMLYAALDPRIRLG